MPNVTVVGIATNIKKGKVVVLWTPREEEPYKGIWSLPVFRTNSYERTKDAVERGVKEITGLGYTVRFFDYFDEIIQADDIHLIMLVFECLATGKLRGHKEVEGLEWVSIEKADSMPLAFEHDQILKAYTEQMKGGVVRYMAKKAVYYLPRLVGIRVPLPNIFTGGK